jgi:hypothetical protein
MVRCCLCEGQRIELDVRLTNVVRGKGVNFCPQAWHLSRRGAVGSPASRQRRRLGSSHHALIHALIGWRTDSLLVFRQVQRMLLVIILVLATVVVISNIAPAGFSP